MCTEEEWEELSKSLGISDDMGIADPMHDDRVWYDSDTIERASTTGRLLRQDVPSWYRINHSVTPNVHCPRIVSRDGRRHLEFRTNRAVRSGEELTFNYGYQPNYYRDVNRNALWN